MTRAPRTSMIDTRSRPAKLIERDLGERGRVGSLTVDDERDVLPPAGRALCRRRDDVDAHQDLATPRRDAGVARPEDDGEARGREHMRPARLGETPVARKDEPDGSAPWLARIARDDALGNVVAIVELETVGRHHGRAAGSRLREVHGAVLREVRALASPDREDRACDGKRDRERA